MRFLCFALIFCLLVRCYALFPRREEVVMIATYQRMMWCVCQHDFHFFAYNVYVRNN